MTGGIAKTVELLDRADRACEEAEELLALHTITIERSHDLIDRSQELLETTTRLIGTRAGKNAEA
jgi:hypothetical protein